MVLLTEIEGVVPFVLRIASLSDEVFFADGIGKCLCGFRRVTAAGASRKGEGDRENKYVYWSRQYVIFGPGD